MAAHRFWRLFLHNGLGSLRELELSTTAGGASALTGGTAFASSDSTGGDVAWRAFDGDTGTSSTWSPASSAARGHWIAYDLGAGNAIDPVEMRVTANWTADLVFTLELSHSDDGRAWTTRKLIPYAVESGGGGVYAFVVNVAWAAPPEIPRRATFGVARYNGAGNSSQSLVGSAPSSRVSRTIGAEIQPVQAVRSFAGTRNEPGQPRIAMFPLLGQKRIAGSTVALGAGVACRVDLLDQITGQLAARTWSSPSGAFAFENVGPGPWTVMAVDETGERNSVVFAHVLAVDA